jgi:hypothetical protein
VEFALGVAEFSGLDRADGARGAEAGVKRTLPIPLNNRTTIADEYLP